jgi:hypothetical protein
MIVWLCPAGAILPQTLQVLLQLWKAVVGLVRPL